MPARAPKLRRRYALPRLGPEKAAHVLRGNQRAKKHTDPIRIPEQPGMIAWKRGHALGLASRYALKEFYQMESGVEIKKYYKQVMKGKLHHRPWRAVKVMDMLERRLDVFTWKVGYYNTIHEARHGIKRGNFQINGRKVVKYKYMLQDGDFLQPNLELRKEGAAGDPHFSAPVIIERIKKRAAIYANPTKYVNDALLKFGAKLDPPIADLERLGALRRFVPRPPAHIPRAHFDMNYTTLSVVFRRSIKGPHDMNDFGDFFGPRMDIMRTWQYYWNSHLSKW